MNLCIIPARGGSKRIPRKNVKPFCNRPIIDYAFLAAQESGLFERIVVSTDDAEIKAMFSDNALDRSEEAATDTATLVDVLNDVCDKVGINYESMCVIYPTALSVTAPVVREFKNAFDAAEADCVFAVKKYSHPIERAFRQCDNWLVMNKEDHMFTRTQDLPQWYYDVGQIYWIKTDSFLKYNKIFMPRTLGIELDAIDIDTEADWMEAEHKYILDNCEI